MNPIPAFPPVPLRPSRRFRWRWFFACAAALFVVAVAAIVLSFRMGGETRALRQAVLAANPGQWERKIEFGVGRLPVLFAKAGLSMARLDLDPAARAAIRAFHSADIGIYERRHDAPRPSESHPGLLSELGRTMHRRGWDCVVAVQNSDETVGIFMPADANSSKKTRACLLVVGRHELVVASIRLDAEPLVDLLAAAQPALLAAR